MIVLKDALKVETFQLKVFFIKISTSQSGLKPHCKTYRKQYYTVNWEKLLEQQKTSFPKNRQKEQE